MDENASTNCCLSMRGEGRPISDAEDVRREPCATRTNHKFQLHWLHTEIVLWTISQGVAPCKCHLKVTFAQSRTRRESSSPSPSSHPWLILVKVDRGHVRRRQIHNLTSFGRTQRLHALRGNRPCWAKMGTAPCQPPFEKTLHGNVFSKK